MGLSTVFHMAMLSTTGQRDKLVFKRVDSLIGSVLLLLSANPFFSILLALFSS